MYNFCTMKVLSCDKDYSLFPNNGFIVVPYKCLVKDSVDKRIKYVKYSGPPYIQEDVSEIEKIASTRDLEIPASWPIKACQLL